MGRFRIIPVFVLTRDRRSGFALKRYLEEEAGFPYPVMAEVYFSPAELVPHLSLYDTNYIIVDYNEHFLESLQALLDQPGNLVYDHKILLRSPSEHFITGTPPQMPGIPLIRDYHDYPAVAEMIRRLMNEGKSTGKFAEANYMLAGLLMMIAVILAIVIL